MLFRVELIVFFGVSCRWCDVYISEAPRKKRLAVAGGLASFGAREPHGKGAGRQQALPAGIFAEAGDRDMDAGFSWEWI